MTAHQRLIDDRLWRRLRAWQDAGVWDRPDPGSYSKSSPRRRCWTGRVVASARCRCGANGGELTGRNPTDRGEAGSKYHLLYEANGLPLHASISPANTHDSKLFKPLLDTNPG